MELSKLFEQFKSICEDVFDEDELDFCISDKVEDIDEWDSINHIHLVVALEKHFKFKFQPNELQNFDTVEDFLNIIRRHL